MTAPESNALDVEVNWDQLSEGGEISATVIMASGFALAEGQTVRERYRVERPLGEGAMGQVLAVTLVGSTDEQTYALKVVARPAEPGDGGEADETERAEAEKQAKWFATLLRQEAAKQEVAQRHGVAVARLFALVRLDDGSIGLRMELARGHSLEGQIERERSRADQPPTVLPAIGIVRKLVSQLRRLHEMKDPGSPFGFIHSDIKPGNVFVDDSDPTDLQVTLLDFGVATAGQALVNDIAVRQGSRKTFVMQQTGGTLGYAPPYHFSTGKPTPLSDVYASVVILYELLTLDLPWSFGDIPQSADNIMMLEAAMLFGPRSVRDVRPSIPEGDAARLDEFFSREFKNLHELAENASKVFDLNDEDVQRAMIERLARLARDYQGKLDQLRNRFSVSRAPAADKSAPRVDRDAATVIPAIPRAAKVPDFGDTATMGSTPAGSDTTGVKRASTTGAHRPSLEVVPSIAPPAPPAAVSRAQSLLSEPPAEKPVVRPIRAWPFVLAGVALPAAAAIWWFAGRDTGPPDGEPVALTRAVEIAHDAGSTVRDAAPDPNGVSGEALRTAPVVNLPRLNARTAHAVDSHADAGTLGMAQRCTCIASVRGTQVVARGGALGREMVLCTASDAVTEGRVEYIGGGVVPAEVFTALPAITCRASEPQELVLQRYRTAAGTATLFHCRRAASTTVNTTVNTNAGANAAARAVLDASAGPAAPSSLPNPPTPQGNTTGTSPPVENTGSNPAAVNPAPIEPSGNTEQPAPAAPEPTSPATPAPTPAPVENPPAPTENPTASPTPTPAPAPTAPPEHAPTEPTAPPPSAPPSAPPAAPPSAPPPPPPPAPSPTHSAPDPTPAPTHAAPDPTPAPSTAPTTP